MRIDSTKTGDDSQEPPLACSFEGCEALHPNAFASEQRLQGWRCPHHDGREIARDAAMDIRFEVFPPVFAHVPLREDFRNAIIEAAAKRVPRALTDRPAIIQLCVQEIRAWLVNEVNMGVLNALRKELTGRSMGLIEVKSHGQKKDEKSR